jgi:hypothetical protein
MNRFNYNSDDKLNVAKSRILQLLRLKYRDPNTIYVESDDTNYDVQFSKILNNINQLYNLFNLLVGYVPIINDKPAFRIPSNIAAYLQTNHTIISLLRNTNLIFNKIINNIGYVEPENITIYRQSFKEMLSLHTVFVQTVTYTGNFDVDTWSTQKRLSLTEKDIYNSLYEQTEEEINELIVYNSRLETTYSYRSKNVNIKRSPHQFNTTDNNNNITDE